MISRFQVDQEDAGTLMDLVFEARARSVRHRDHDTDPRVGVAAGVPHRSATP